MGWESSDLVRSASRSNEAYQTYKVPITCLLLIRLGAPPSRSNDGSLALVSCLSDASVLRCARFCILFTCGTYSPTIPQRHECNRENKDVLFVLNQPLVTFFCS